MMNDDNDDYSQRHTRCERGGSTFKEPKIAYDLPQPISGCEGSVMRNFDGTLLFSAPGVAPCKDDDEEDEKHNEDGDSDDDDDQHL